MARKPRLFVSEIPYHVVQRGNNKNPIFIKQSDYHCFLSVLEEAKQKHPCLIYSYCLMPNHFHLLLVPESKENVSLFMKFVGAKYVRYFNKSYSRTGTLWEGRFRCSIIDENAYFLACLRYIEMNPVRAKLAKTPETYHWSSYKVRACGNHNPLVNLDAWYKSLGETPQQCQNQYKKISQFFSEQDNNLIRSMTKKNAIVGNDNFKARIEISTQCQIKIREPGRPSKCEK